MRDRTEVDAADTADLLQRERKAKKREAATRGGVKRREKHKGSSRPHKMTFFDGFSQPPSAASFPEIPPVHVVTSAPSLSGSQSFEGTDVLTDIPPAVIIKKTGKSERSGKKRGRKVTDRSLERETPSEEGDILAFDCDATLLQLVRDPSSGSVSVVLHHLIVKHVHALIRRGLKPKGFLVATARSIAKTRTHIRQYDECAVIEEVLVQYVVDLFACEFPEIPFLGVSTPDDLIFGCEVGEMYQKVGYYRELLCVQEIIEERGERLSPELAAKIYHPDVRLQYFRFLETMLFVHRKTMLGLTNQSSSSLGIWEQFDLLYKNLSRQAYQKGGILSDQTKNAQLKQIMALHPGLKGQFFDDRGDMCESAVADPILNEILTVYQVTPENIFLFKSETEETFYELTQRDITPPALPSSASPVSKPPLPSPLTLARNNLSAHSMFESAYQLESSRTDTTLTQTDNPFSSGGFASFDEEDFSTAFGKFSLDGGNL